MSEVTVRAATLTDVAVLTEIVVSATLHQGRFPPAGTDGFDLDEWRAGFQDATRRQIEDSDSPSALSVIEVDGRAVGRLRIVRTAEAIKLAGIQLLPAAQRRGIGSSEVRKVQAEARQRGISARLSVERDNPDARRLYERLGFTLDHSDDREHHLRWT